MEVKLKKQLAATCLALAATQAGADENLLGSMSCENLPERIQELKIAAGHVDGPKNYDEYITDIDNRTCSMLQRGIEISEITELDFLFYFVDGWEKIYQVKRMDLLRGKEDEIAAKDPDAPGTIFRFPVDSENRFHNLAILNLNVINDRYRDGSEYVIPYRIMMVFDWEDNDRVSAFRLRDLRK